MSTFADRKRRRNKAEEARNEGGKRKGPDPEGQKKEMTGGQRGKSGKAKNANFAPV